MFDACAYDAICPEHRNTHVIDHAIRVTEHYAMSIMLMLVPEPMLTEAQAEDAARQLDCRLAEMPCPCCLRQSAALN